MASWRANQGFDTYDEARRPWLEILLQKGLQGPLQTEAGVLDIMFSLMYDLDAVRQLVGSPVFRQIRELEDETLDSIQRDDSALLKFSYRFLTDLLLTEGRLVDVKARLMALLAGGANT